jgi:uncharacterized GH25 family protein
MPRLISREPDRRRLNGRGLAPGIALVGPLFLLVLLLAGPLAAHDFWIQPSTFRPAPGQRVAVHLRVGDEFPGDPVPRMQERIEHFTLIDPAGAAADLPGVPGTDPAGFALPQKPGRAILVYDSDNASVTLEAEKFEKYLSDQGLEKISELRRKKGQSQAPGREVYSRCSKALLKVGDGPATGFDRAAGLPLELVPERDPYSLAAGGELPVRLLYLGKPLAGALVEARQPGRPGKIAGRTDARGRVALRLPAGGFWLVRALHMIAAPAGANADWESFWASLTFELPASPAAGR